MSSETGSNYNGGYGTAASTSSSRPASANAATGTYSRDTASRDSNYGGGNAQSGGSPSANARTGETHHDTTSRDSSYGGDTRTGTGEGKSTTSSTSTSPTGPRGPLGGDGRPKSSFAASLAAGASGRALAAAAPAVASPFSNMRGPLDAFGNPRLGLTPQTRSYQNAEIARTLDPKGWGKYTQAQAQAGLDALTRALPSEAFSNKYGYGAMPSLARVSLNQVTAGVPLTRALSWIDSLKQRAGTKNLQTQGLATPGSYDHLMAQMAMNDALQYKGVAEPTATNFAVGKPVRGTTPIGQIQKNILSVDPAFESRVNKAVARQQSILNGVNAGVAAAEPEDTHVASVPKEGNNVPAMGISAPISEQEAFPGRSRIDPMNDYRQQRTDSILAQAAALRGLAHQIAERQFGFKLSPQTVNSAAKVSKEQQVNTQAKADKPTAQQWDDLREFEKQVKRELGIPLNNEVAETNTQTKSSALAQKPSVDPVVSALGDFFNLKGPAPFPGRSRINPMPYESERRLESLKAQLAQTLGQVHLAKEKAFTNASAPSTRPAISVTPQSKPTRLVTPEPKPGRPVRGEVTLYRDWAAQQAYKGDDFGQDTPTNARAFLADQKDRILADMGLSRASPANRPNIAISLSDGKAPQGDVSAAEEVLSDPQVIVNLGAKPVKDKTGFVARVLRDARKTGEGKRNAGALVAIAARTDPRTSLADPSTDWYRWLLAQYS